MRMLLRSALLSSALILPIDAAAQVTGASTTYNATQCGSHVLRSNSSSPMRDLFPGGVSVLPVNCLVTVYNDDPSGLLEIRASSGAKLDGVSTNFILIGPRQTAAILSDGTDYRTVQRESKARVAPTIFPPLPTPGLFTTYPVWYVNRDPLVGSDTNSGINPTTPFRTVQAAYDFVYRSVDLNGGGMLIQLADSATPYDRGLVCSFSTPGFNTRGVPFVALQGNVSNPSLTHIAPQNLGQYDGPDAILVSSSCYLYLRGIKLSAPSPGGSAIKAVFWGFVTTWDGVEVGAAPYGSQFLIEKGYANMVFPYTVSGDAPTHINIQQGGHLLKGAGATMAAVGTRTFSNAVIVVNGGGSLAEFFGGPVPPGAGWSGTINGVKAKVTKCGILDTGGGGSPGSIASPAPTCSQIY